MPSFAQMGLNVPDLLLPCSPIAPTWPCIACDQYTSQPDFWQRMEAFVGDAPSTLKLILPEAFLDQTDVRLPKVLSCMQEYEKNVLTQEVHGFVLTLRTTKSGARLGLVLAVDLEAYEYTPDSVSPIRATEGTILSRIPPRVRVREQAILESSHILLLANDKKNALLPALYAKVKNDAPLYDLELAFGGGHLTGWAVTGAALELARAGFARLWEEKGDDPFLAVGDGNHSLATAKAIWQNLRGKVADDHPARYAMCEVTNLYDDALVFEPIHRCLFSVDRTALEGALSGFASRPADMSLRPGRDQALLVDTQGARLYEGVPLRQLQAVLDEQTGKAFSCLDYVHGDEAVLTLGRQDDCAAILLPAMDKFSLFSSIADGPLPRKAFSMGEANEKRHYMECRRILP